MIKKLFNKCKKKNLNSIDVEYKLYRKGISYDDFAKELAELIYPIYLSAENMGFGEWRI